MPRDPFLGPQPTPITYIKAALATVVLVIFAIIALVFIVATVMGMGELANLTRCTDDATCEQVRQESPAQDDWEDR